MQPLGQDLLREHSQRRTAEGINSPVRHVFYSSWPCRWSPNVARCHAVIFVVDLAKSRWVRRAKSFVRRFPSVRCCFYVLQSMDHDDKHHIQDLPCRECFLHHPDALSLESTVDPRVFKYANTLATAQDLLPTPPPSPVIQGQGAVYRVSLPTGAKDLPPTPPPSPVLQGQGAFYRLSLPVGQFGGSARSTALLLHIFNWS